MRLLINKTMLTLFFYSFMMIFITFWIQYFLNKIMSKCIGKENKFTIYFDWLEIKKVNFYVMYFILLKLNQIIALRPSAYVYKILLIFQINFCVKILQQVEIKEPKMTFVGRTTLSLI